VIDALESFGREQEAERAIIVTDEALVDAGIVEPAVTALADAGVSSEIYNGVVTEPKIRTVEEVMDTIRVENYDIVVGVGGGSCLDTAKVASVVVERDLTIRDVIGIDQVPEHGLPLVLAPTTAGTGSEVTDGAVLTDTDDGGIKKVIVSDHLLADLALVDPDLTETLPPAVAASTGADALTHAVEAFVTTSRSPVTDGLCRTAIETIGNAFVDAVHEGTEAARYDMSVAAAEAGLGFSNAGLGAVHALTYPIGIEYGTGHGFANAILLPYVMAYNIPAEPARFAEISRLLGRTQDPGQSTRDFAYESVDAVVELLDAVDLPASLQSVGNVDPGQFSEFADIALEYSSHNIERNPRELHNQDIVTVFEYAYHGDLPDQSQE
jgi:alcohol dehydrogenase